MNICIKISTTGLPVWLAIAALLLFRFPAISLAAEDSKVGTIDPTSETESGKIQSTELKLSVRSRNDSGEWSADGIEGIKVRLHSRMLYPEGKRLPDLELVSDSKGLIQAPVRDGDSDIAFNMEVISDHYHLPTLHLPRLPQSFTWPERTEIWVTPLISIGGHIELSRTGTMNPAAFKPENTEIRCRIFNTLAVRPFQITNPGDLVSSPDASGKWSAEIPANRDSASILLFFNELAQVEYFYIENNFGHERYRSLESINKVQDWDISMTPASIISGKVLNPGGNPEGGARILAVPSYSSQRIILNYLNIPLGAHQTNSKADGSFELLLNLPTSYDIRGFHPDYYADLININSDDQEEIIVDIPMVESVSLEGIVTDNKGRNISGARIRLMSANNSPPARPVEVRTGNNGTFTLEKVPKNSPVTLQIEKPEFGINHKVTLVTDSKPGTIRNIEVHRKVEFKISFEARDSVSNLPIEGLKILHGRAFQSTDTRVSYWNTFLNLPEEDGVYTYAPNQRNMTTGSRVGFALSAQGYKPFVSTLYELQDEHEISVNLTPWNGLQGIVVDTTGNPLKDCTVLMTGTGYTTIQPRGIIDMTGIGNPTNRTLTTTDENGYFRLDPWVSKARIIAYSRNGYAEQMINTDEYNESLRMELKPLVSITGMLLKSDRTPWPGQKLVFYSSMDPTDNWNYRLMAKAFTTNTDRNGNFKFNAMPPIDGYIQRIVNSQAIGSARDISIDISIPDRGDIAGLQMGGTGSLCSVRILPDDSFNPENQLIVATLTEVEELPPDHIRKNPTLLELWKKSQINRKKRTRLNRYCGDVDDNGFIQFENVETGKYKFIAQVFAKDAGVNQNFKLRVVYESEFPIEAGPGKKLDLGIVEPSKRLNIEAGTNIKLAQ